MRDLVKNLAKGLVSLIAALAVVAMLLTACYRFIVEPARATTTSTQQAEDQQSPGGIKGLAVSLLLESKRSSLEPVTSNPDAPPISFEVFPGESAADVAFRLQNVGLIRDATAFRLLLQHNAMDRHIEAGKFELSPAMSSQEIAEALMHAQGNDVVVVILEGWRLEQTAEALQEALGIGDGFLRLAALQASRLLPTWLEASQVVSLEGVLFPDTYRFAPDASPDDVVHAMLSNFEAKFTEVHRQRATELGLTPYGVLTLASIVEREAVVREERPTIAAVFLNRLAADMKLEADPTVQYALGYQADSGLWWKAPLLIDDLRNTVSPYNTYLNAGLPPGPICSPGIATVEAVLWPADVDYLYFVARGDGSHAFASSWEEHLSNVAKYQGG